MLEAMDKRTRSRKGFEEHDVVCPICNHKHDEVVIDKIFVRSGNKFAMNSVCDGCTERVVVQKHTLGTYSLYEYVDYKKIRMIKNGWIQKRFYGKQG